MKYIHLNDNRSYIGINRMSIKNLDSRAQIT